MHNAFQAFQTIPIHFIRKDTVNTYTHQRTYFYNVISYIGLLLSQPDKELGKYISKHIE